MKIGNSHCRSEADYGAASTILGMSITALVFPFDLYGSPGTRAGAELLGDALREIRTDGKSESRDSRSKAYRDQLKILAQNKMEEQNANAAVESVALLIKAANSKYTLAGTHKRSPA